jgi:hypothetical protein
MNLSKIATLSLGLALAASAFPSVASAQNRPSYATADEDTVHGRIVSMPDQYDISVRDEKGYVDRVRLHQGTIINPTGLSLHPGMTVTVLGVNSGDVLAANEIDTPYNYVPAYVGPYAPAYYAYPAYPVYPYGYYPYYYAYGYPSIAIGFRFGGGYHYRGGFGGHFRR